MTTLTPPVEGAIVEDTVVAARASWSRTLRQGQFMRIIDLEGKQAVDFLCYNAHDHADAAGDAGAADGERLVELVPRGGGDAGRQPVVQPGLAEARDERAHHGHAEGAADHPAHREDPRRHAGLALLDGVHGGGAHRRHHEAHAQAHQHEGADEEAVVGVRAQVALPEQRDRGDHEAERHEDARSDLVGQAPGDGAHHDDHGGGGQEPHARLQR